MVQDKKKKHFFFFLQSDRTSLKSILEKKLKITLPKGTSCQHIISMGRSKESEERPQNQKTNTSKKFYLMIVVKLSILNHQH